MKLTAILLTAACLSAAATGNSQAISFSGKQVPLKNVFTAIEKQTGYVFFYDAALLKEARPVTLDVKDAPLEAVLNLAFKDQPLSWTLVNKTITIVKKASPNLTDPVVIPGDSGGPPPIDVKGRIVNEAGEPVAGASVQVKGDKNKGTSTDANGYFELKGVDENATLVISAVNIESYEVKVEGKNDLVTLTVKMKITALDETIVKGYYTTTRRLNTGSIGKVTSQEIGRQPVINPLATLQGRIPGLVVTQNNGLPTSTFSIQIRGRGSLLRGTEPLFVIDGVPFLNTSISSLQSSPQSLYASINPSDIESIEVLKDADATAIYGSQGANGVVLITTKKGKEGQTRISANYYAGWGKVTRTADLLNTQQYIAMRKEAFQNDGMVPDQSVAPDLTIWDENAYTDWKKMLIGGTAKFTNAEASISGGDSQTQFLFSTSYNRQTTVFPQSDATQKGSAYLNLVHSSLDKKFKALFSVSYSIFKPSLPTIDFSSLIYLPPNTPSIYDANGNFSWDKWTIIENPLAQTLRTYESENNTMIANSVLEYKLLPTLTVKTNFGYSLVKLNEYSARPIKSQRPDPGVTTASAAWAQSTLKSYIIEPQINYENTFGKGNLEILAGGSFQQRKQEGMNIFGSDYTDDDLLRNIGSATTITAQNIYTLYRYSAFYGNGNFNWDKKYVINVNVRRDGSSRFGPDKRFSTFGAVGAAWIFSNEAFLNSSSSIFSFGKLRGSYGVTGNDQISDYEFFDTWSTPFYSPYQGAPGIVPDRLFNQDFRWERNKKLEFALDLGFFRDRLLFTSAYYRNRCGNQLINYTLPSQTGFISILKNSDAEIENTGLEFELSGRIIQNKNFRWTSSFNITIPKNKLLKYPGLAESPYRYTFALGKPLETIFAFQSNGVNPQTGIYEFEDVDNDGFIQFELDFLNVVSIRQKFYGGWQNTFSLGNFEVNFFFHFVKQNGRNYLYSLPTTPGFLSNQPALVFDRWQKPGDNSSIQKFTSFEWGAEGAAFQNLRNSSALISDASFIRFKNLSVSYNLPKNLLKKWRVSNIRLYGEAQNLFTVTNYLGADPEMQNMSALPPLKVMTFGLQLTL